MIQLIGFLVERRRYRRRILKRERKAFLSSSLERKRYQSDRFSMGETFSHKRGRLKIIIFIIIITTIVRRSKKIQSPISRDIKNIGYPSPCSIDHVLCGTILLAIVDRSIDSRRSINAAHQANQWPANKCLLFAFVRVNTEENEDEGEKKWRREVTVTQ